MFVDTGGWRQLPPKPRPPRLTKSQERTLAWIVGLNLVLCFLGPIAGGTLFAAVAALLRR